MGKLLAGVIIGGLGVYAYQRAHQPEPARVAEYDQAPVQRPVPVALPAVEMEDSKFHCDGRTRCPEMKSCAEAEFFLANCPGPKMDGDGDGIPCEDQHCGH
jgi:hypothetical protein